MNSDWEDALWRMQEIDRRHDVERRLRDKEEECEALQCKLGLTISHVGSLDSKCSELREEIEELHMMVYGRTKNAMVELLAYYKKEVDELNSAYQNVYNERETLRWQLRDSWNEVEELRKKVK